MVYNIGIKVISMRRILHSCGRSVNNGHTSTRALPRGRDFRLALAAAASLIFLLAAGCDTVTNGSGGGEPYVCANGTPITGNAPGANSVGCQVCNDGFILDGDGNPGVGVSCVTIPYVCTNGTPAPGGAPAENTTGCQVCNDGFALDGRPGPGTGCGFAYTCDNGDPAVGVAPTQGDIGCSRCAAGYRLSGPAGPDTTCAFSYICENGTPNPDVSATFGTVACRSCNTMFILMGTADAVGTTCISDFDNDNVADVEDVDDDNDGLIEIASLAELDNVRHNLAGTSYDDEADDTGSGDTGDTTGAPTAATANCSAATNGVYLCGYELTTNLDFDLDNDGGTFDTAIAVGVSGALDAGDAASYFAVDANNRGGWVPIGPGGGADDDAILANSFNAIFEGNNNTISNLASIRNLPYMGLFGRVGVNGHIRNLGVIDAGVSTHATASNTNTFQGGVLAGRVEGGTVTGCYATGSVFAGGRRSSANRGFTTQNITDAQGGLVGVLEEAVVIASHADVDVTGDDGEREALGGLIGVSIESTIIASYADGDIDATTVNIDTGVLYGGALVAVSAESSRIIASYATGSVTFVPAGSDTSANSRYYYYGGLVGRLLETPVSASYSTGDVTGTGGRNITTRYFTGGFVGAQLNVSSIISASYATGDVTVNAGRTGNNRVLDSVGNLLGIQGTDITNSLVRASYGFGDATLTGAMKEITNPPPAGVSVDIGLNADNVQTCNNRAYTTQSACESASLTITPGVWSTADSTCSAPVSDATDGVDYTAFTAQAACETTAKTAADVWTSWNSADDYTLNAWVFEGGVAPKLRYADYDGTGTVVDCDMFPAIIPGTTTPLVCGANGSELGGQ